MEQQALGTGEMRFIILVVGLVTLALIYFFGRPRKPGQGTRKPPPSRGTSGERVEPTFDGDDDTDRLDAVTEGDGEQLDLLGDAADAEPRAPKLPPRPLVGVRPEGPIDRIVTVFVCARPGETITGSDLVVAAEKAGLVFGDRGIFHRMLAGKHEKGPIFSMANMVKPGHFDMARVDTLATPGVTFFLALPGPLPALDAWDALLPTAQRLAELLDASVLDEKRNTLGRQGIAHIRDELRAWDRKQESTQIRPHR
ncbi:cell division protein ZipA [Dokdonella sp. MW10]|uniref:cell division protein ZipA n=1 Tax=Dokdonella sp. MW10 TaxID=2992926 RepID=UPI003F816C6F